MSGKRRLSRTVWLAPWLLSAAAGVWAQTTGGVIGRVSDESGAVLAGVAVEAQSAALQGTRTTVTESDGSYRLSLLPPGTYRVIYSSSGFADQAQEGVVVSLDKITTLNVSLVAAAAETITVTADSPVLDPTTSGLGANLSPRQIQTLPTGRNYSSVVQVVPGVSTDANPDNKDQDTITVYGSSGAENSFFIDGVNTTGIEYGFQGKNLNFEFIQEVDVKSGGYEAEYGRSTGGIVNVITKTGGNEFHGDVFAYYDDDSLQNSAATTGSAGGTVTGFTKEDYGVGIGGYIRKDRLWFFAAYDRVEHTQTSALPGGPLAGTEVESPSDRDLGSLKLTFNVTQGQSLVASFFQDPREDTGAISDAQHSLNGEPSTYEGKREFGGEDYALRYEGILGSAWALSAQAARHQEENSVGPAGAAGDVIQTRIVDADFFQTGGFGLIQDKSFERDFFGVAATRFLTRHELKAGIEYEDEQAEVVRRYSGGRQIDAFNTTGPGPLVFSHFYWTTPTATEDDAPVSQLTASPQHKNTTVFLQDRWNAGRNLTLNLGLRWDRQEIIDAAGTKQIDLKDDYAPRLGFVWDPEGEGRSKVFGSAGRYYEQIPMDLVIRSFSFERQARIFNFSPTSTTPDPAAGSSAIFGGFTEPSDPNLENQYIVEYIAGYERTMAPDLAVGAKAIYRSYEQVVEDFLCADDGTYCIGNPSEGIMKRVFTLDYSQTFPAPEPKRVYKGLQLDATKRFSNDWQAMASYIYSKLDGNYDGEYSPFTNIGADPNISAAYDYFDFFTDGRDLSRITNDGPLSNDRRHQFKVSGIYLTPWKLSIGAAAYYRTGTPLTRYGYSDAYGRYEFFLSDRGGEGRQPSTYEVDVHLGYPIEVGAVTINVLGDVFNLLDAQRPLLLDQRWGFQEADNFSPTPVNPNYGKAVLRTGPRALRLGVRLSF